MSAWCVWFASWADKGGRMRGMFDGPHSQRLVILADGRWKTSTHSQENNSRQSSWQTRDTTEEMSGLKSAQISLLFRWVNSWRNRSNKSLILGCRTTLLTAEHGGRWTGLNQRQRRDLHSASPRCCRREARGSRTPRWRWRCWPGGRPSWPPPSWCPPAVWADSPPAAWWGTSRCCGGAGSRCGPSRGPLPPRRRRSNSPKRLWRCGSSWNETGPVSLWGFPNWRLPYRNFVATSGQENPRMILFFF